MVNESLEAHPVVEDTGWKLEIEGNCIRVIGQAIHLRYLFLNGVDLKILSVFYWPSPEIILENLCPYHLKVYCYPFVESLYHEEVVLEVVIAVITGLVSRDWTGILLLLDEEEDPAIVC